jgi:hypothetical protein
MSDPTPQDPNPGAPDAPYAGAPYAAPPPAGTPPAGYQGGPPPAAWSGARPRGPIGEARSAGITILLTIVTCGIWSILWSYWTHEEMKRYRGDGLGGVVALVIAIFITPVIMFTVPMEIELMYREEGMEPPVTTIWGLWFLLPIIGNFIWYLKVQEALNDFWVARGAAPA